SPMEIYGPERGYGFITSPQAEKASNNRSICSEKPFAFAVDVPEGNYNVNVVLGDDVAESTTILKAEARRLLLASLHVAAGRVENRKFTVNVRHNRLASGEQVRLKPDEQGHPDWDDRLTLEFSGDHPCLRALEVEKAQDAITVYIAGDS